MRRFVSGIAVVAGLAGSCLAQGSAAPAAPKTWADSLKFKGDVRYRYESIEDDTKGSFTRERQRIRARLGAGAKLSDTLKAGVRLSTGKADPVSGNQTLGDGFTKKELRLDQAYLDWAWVKEETRALNLVAGKFKNPFSTVCDRTKMDLLWDSDLSPEGISLQGETAMGPATFKANGGYLWVQERSRDDDDTMLYVGQGAATFRFTPELYLTFGASYYDYDKLQGMPLLDWEDESNSFGNSTANKVSGGTTNKVYKYDYNQLEFFAELGTFVGTCPVTLYGQTVENGEPADLNQGYLAGLTVGKAKKPKTWEVGYRYAELEKDAVVGAFTDSDRWGGGTDGKGHRVHGRYQIAKNLQVGVTYFMDDKKVSDAAKTGDYKRMQADLVCTF
jgi:hypothetical protein